MPTINGTPGNDALTGTSEADIINGLAGDDQLSGLEGNDELNGGEGNDVLDGGAPFFGMFEHEFRPNLLAGGPGNDTYLTTGFNVNDGVRFQPDTISELVGEGNDVVLTARSYQLAAGAEIEELRLTQPSSDGVAVYSVGLGGNEFANLIVANAGSQVLLGGEGSDRLYGMAGYDRLEGGPGDDLLDGGEGQDNLAGGEGNDTYFTDGAASLSESAGAGDDTAVASANFQLFAGVSIETVRTSAPLGTDPLSLGGNEVGQSIYGNAGNNVLNGFGGIDYLVGIGGNDTLDGGAGADFLQGGIGNDLYRVDNAGDVVYENFGEGDDRIAASVSYTLGAGVEVEVLSTTIGTGTDPINLTGNELAQSLYGNQGVNSLNGGAGNDYLVGLGGDDFLLGGAGDDNMAGGQGNDIYYLDAAGDAIFEAAGEGDDLAVAFASFVLGSGQSVETMAAADSAGAISLTGNLLAQSIYGNASANVLNGGGGNDYLVGGSGADRFVFAGAPGNDAIGDFLSGTDKIDLGAYGITAAQVSSSTSGGNTLLSVDSNSDGSADFTINLIGSGPPASGDFIF